MLQIIVTKRRLEFEISQLWAKIKNTFARISHTHSISDVSELSLVLNEIRALIQPAPEKEVVNVLSASDTMPEDPSEGDRWIDIENNLLYSYSEDDGWGEDNPDKGSVYITSDTSHIYLWNGSEFVDSTGQPVDNTLYVHNTTTELEQYTDRGMYNVCVGGDSWYTMVVSSSRRTFFGRPPRVSVTYRQLLCNNDGWYVRTKVNNGEWSEWTEHAYSYIGHAHTQAEIEGLSAALDEIRALIQPAPDKEVVSVLCAGGERPASADDGERWLDLENGLVYEYSEDDGWGTIDPSSDCVYIASDTSHIYVWNGSEFVDSTGEPIDNTLYVSNLTTDLADFVDRGMYSLCYTRSISSRWYTFTVSKSRGKARIGQPIPIITTQMLMSNDGWQTRSKVDDGEWSEWTEHTFSYEGHKHLLTDITNVAVAPDSDAALWVPIEAATITAIVKGSYDPQDTAMFSGHPDYVPMTSAEVSAWVGVAMDAFRASLDPGSGSGSGSNE